MAILATNRSSKPQLEEIMRPILFALIAVAMGCSGSDTLVAAIPAPPAAVAVVQASFGPPTLPDWIRHPFEFPAGLMGSNNCTFAPGAATAQWDFHPDGGCWERLGPDGWTRQQQHRIHVTQHAACGGGAADLSNTRVCRAPSVPNPCAIDLLTGPNGCARCVIQPVVCH